MSTSTTELDEIMDTAGIPIMYRERVEAAITALIESRQTDITQTFLAELDAENQLLIRDQNNSGVSDEFLDGYQSAIRDAALIRDKYVKKGA